MDRNEEMMAELQRLRELAEQKEAEASTARKAYYDKIAEFFALRSHEKSAP